MEASHNATITAPTNNAAMWPTIGPIPHMVRPHAQCFAMHAAKYCKYCNADNSVQFDTL
jgi:hypothetical protein